MNAPVSFLTNLRQDRLQRSEMLSWNKIINALKRNRGNINPFTTFKPSGWKCHKTIGLYVSCAFIEIWSTWKFGEHSIHLTFNSEIADNWIIFSISDDDKEIKYRLPLYNQNWVLLRIFRALQTSACFISRWTHADVWTYVFFMKYTLKLTKKHHFIRKLKTRKKTKIKQ